MRHAAVGAVGGGKVLAAQGAETVVAVGQVGIAFAALDQEIVLAAFAENDLVRGVELPLALVAVLETGCVHATLTETGVLAK